MATVGHGLAPARTVLDNGAALITKQTRKTPIVAINLVMRAGSICDSDATLGATYLLSRVIDRGTSTRSASEIAEELDDRGISLTVTVTRHLFSLVCTCLAEDFVPVFRLLGEMVMAPSVPVSELERRRGEVVTGLRQDEDSPAVRAVETLMAQLHGPSHPYGRRAKGTFATIERLERSQLVDLHAARFAPSELCAVVVGDVETALVADVAQDLLGKWRKPPPAPIAVPPPPRPSERRRIVVPMLNKAQTDVAYGFSTIMRSDPAYYAFWLMNHALGQYALGGRLGDRIRERQGMAYYVTSVFEANVVNGPLMIRAGVSAQNVDRAIASIDDELVLLRRSGLTPKELNESRQYLIGSMPRALETNAGIAQFLQTAEFFGLGLDYDVRLPALLSSVTLDQAHAMALRYLDPDGASIVVAGPYQELGIEN